MSNFGVRDRGHPEIQRALFCTQEHLKTCYCSAYCMRALLQHRIVKFLIAGSTATGVNLGALYVLVDLFGVWYIFSASIAFLIGFCVSFTLQKFWTFGNRETEKIASQAFLYFLIVAGNLGLNALGMYVLVDIFGLWYMLAEVLLLGTIACESFFLYQILVFKTLPRRSHQEPAVES